MSDSRPTAHHLLPRRDGRFGSASITCPSGGSAPSVLKPRPVVPEVRGLGCVVLVALLARPTSAVSILGRADWRPAVEPLKRLASIGLPSMFEALFRSGGMLMFTVIVFQLGTAVVAAQQIAQRRTRLEV